MGQAGVHGRPDNTDGVVVGISDDASRCAPAPERAPESQFANSWVPACDSVRCSFLPLLPRFVGPNQLMEETLLLFMDPRYGIKASQVSRAAHG